MNIEFKTQPKYILSQSFSGHKAAVRSVSYQNSLLISGASDKVAKLYQFDNNKYEMINTLDFYSQYIYAVAFIQGGGFAIGSGNQVFLHDIEGNPIGILEGHTGQVCSLSCTHQNQLISGSWDSTAIVWDLKTQKCQYILQGHKYGVAVHNSNDDIDEVITGSQDGILRSWIKGKEVHSIQAHQDIIREIISINDIGFLTCSNDETIKLWSKQFQILSTFIGHSGFIFSIKSLNMMGQRYYFSASDDNSVKLWQNQGEQIQSINHPGTVWSICLNEQNGDLITACSDGKIRIFVLQDYRKATEDDLLEFEKENELALASGPEGLSEEQLKKTPNIEQMSSIRGKKNGEVKIFRNGKKPEVYAWNAETQQWDKIGDVVGGSNKKNFSGDEYFQAGEYDYIFDVDDDTGVPKLLPLNDGDNHLDVAERFCRREGYSKSYLTQVMTFLRKNTKQQQSQSQQQSKQQLTQAQQFECIPYSQFFYFESMNLDGLSKKVMEFNAKMKEENQKLSLGDLEVLQFNQAIETLKNTSYYHISNIESPVILIVVNKLLRWPSQYMLPVIDFLRIFQLHHSSEKIYSGLDSGITIFTELQVHVQYHQQSAVFVRLVLQSLCNLFKYNANTFAALRSLEIISEMISNPIIMKNNDAKISEVLSNLLLNFSIAIYQKPQQSNGAGQILGTLIFNFLQSQNRADDAIAKVITAIGNLTLSTDPEVRMQIKQVIGNSINTISLNDEQIQKCIKEVILSLSRC